MIPPIPPKTLKYATALVTCLITLSLPSGSAANEKLTVSPKRFSAKKLHLNGSAVRTVFGFEVYNVELFLTTTADSEKIIFNDRDPKRVKITMRRDVTGKKFESTVRKNIKTNFSSEEKTTWDAELERFLTCFVNETLQEGCTVMIDYLPSKGTRVAIDGKVADTIPGDDFHHALLRLWIGDPPQKSVKKGLLGK